MVHNTAGVAWLDGKAWVFNTSTKVQAPPETCFVPHGSSCPCKQASSSDRDLVQVPGDFDGTDIPTCAFSAEVIFIICCNLPTTLHCNVPDLERGRLHSDNMKHLVK
jgi:hypothetical protein